jgi:hypothetical protein
VIPVSQRALAMVLAAGCASWCALAFLRTGRMAALIGASEREVRALGVRDAGSLLTLLASRDPRPAIAARVLFDAADALRFGRGRPRVMAMTTGFAALGAVALLARRPPAAA